MLKIASAASSDATTAVPALPRLICASVIKPKSKAANPLPQRFISRLRSSKR